MEYDKVKAARIMSTVLEATRASSDLDHGNPILIASMMESIMQLAGFAEECGLPVYADTLRFIASGKKPTLVQRATNQMIAKRLTFEFGFMYDAVKRSELFERTAKFAGIEWKIKNWIDSVIWHGQLISNMSINTGFAELGLKREPMVYSFGLMKAIMTGIDAEDFSEAMEMTFHFFPIYKVESLWRMYGDGAPESARLIAKDEEMCFIDAMEEFVRFVKIVYHTDPPSCDNFSTAVSPLVPREFAEKFASDHEMPMVKKIGGREVPFRIRPRMMRFSPIYYCKKMADEYVLCQYRTRFGIQFKE
ncbi:MAG: hypothetical protein HC888_00705 [Candidatus Competibacteraceae bacterium]|nr:hypothetical protein [Candidatus Competibacteraceae bacterium]